jgi:hypothetical protein
MTYEFHYLVACLSWDRETNLTTVQVKVWDSNGEKALTLDTSTVADIVIDNANYGHTIGAELDITAQSELVYAHFFQGFIAEFCVSQACKIDVQPNLCPAGNCSTCNVDEYYDDVQQKCMSCRPECVDGCVRAENCELCPDGCEECSDWNSCDEC